MKVTIPRYQLFDLESDPGATTDVAAETDREVILEDMIDLMIDARVALEDRTGPRIALF